MIFHQEYPAFPLFGIFFYELCHIALNFINSNVSLPAGKTIENNMFNLDIRVGWMPVMAPMIPNLVLTSPQQFLRAHFSLFPI
jgi:hypothetical protein